MSKYHARRTVLDGITFDSKAEAARYGHLNLMQKAGLIKNLKLQVPFELIPAEMGPEGRKLRPLKYVADFVYEDSAGREHIEDVKGFRTREFIIKKRLMWHILGLSVEEV